MVNLSIIKDLATRKKISIVELAEKIGISSQGLYKAISENSTRVETLEKIAEVLQVPISTFFTTNSIVSDNVAEYQVTKIVDGDSATLQAENEKLRAENAKLQKQVDTLFMLLDKMDKVNKT